MNAMISNKRTALSFAICSSLLLFGLTSPSTAAPAKKAVTTTTLPATTADTPVPGNPVRDNSPTQKGNLPNGKPFRYIQAQIADLQQQIDVLVGRVTSMEDRVTATEAAIERLKLQNERLQALIDAARTDIARLQQRVDTNDALIALLQSQLDEIKATVAMHSQILDSRCPEGQFVQGYSATSGLLCSIGTGSGSLSQTRASQTYTVASTSQVDAYVDCPAGTVPSGGAYDAVPGLAIYEPGSTATGYGVTVVNTTGADLIVNVYTNCLGLQH